MNIFTSTESKTPRVSHEIVPHIYAFIERTTPNSDVNVTLEYPSAKHGDMDTYSVDIAASLKEVFETLLLECPQYGEVEHTSYIVSVFVMKPDHYLDGEYLECSIQQIQTAVLNALNQLQIFSVNSDQLIAVNTLLLPKSAFKKELFGIENAEKGLVKVKIYSL